MQSIFIYVPLNKDIINRPDKSKEDNDKYTEFLSNIQNVGSGMYQPLQSPYMPMYNTSAIDYSMYGDMTGGQQVIYYSFKKLKNKLDTLLWYASSL